MQSVREAHADKQAYDLQIRPELMLEAVRTLQDAGVEPDVWKIEGLDRREDCERLVETARRGGRDDVGCIVLGHGANENNVVATDWYVRLRHEPHVDREMWTVKVARPSCLPTRVYWIESSRSSV